jgi:phytoene/squalene synthetase
VGAFSPRRPARVLKGLLADRDDPGLDRLRAIQDPDEFIWAILPHAARTFAACIALLPERCVDATAVGYLYCRILDTYEDLPDRAERETAMRAFAARVAEPSPLPSPPPVPRIQAGDRSDLCHLLLVERCDLVDRVFERLDDEQRDAIRQVVGDMAEGMCWSSEIFETQGGVLANEEQLARYCRIVLGNPVVFTLRLLRGERIDEELRETGMQVGELVQCANVTRDIESDLKRGVGYHPALKAHLDSGAAPEEIIRTVRGEIMRFALARAPAYTRMVESMDFPRVSFGRASSVLMALFTDRYYRGCAARAGLPAWDGIRTTLGLLAQTVPSYFSWSWSRRILERIELEFVNAARR